MDLDDDPDVVVVGGGPAGCAAALWATRQSLRVRLLHRDQRPGYQPGETLPPAVEPLFDQLGALGALTAATTGRRPGHVARWDGAERRVEYGADHRGQWMGFHVRREELARCLRGAAAAAGVDVRHCAKVTPRVDSCGRVLGVDDGTSTVRARLIIDASGPRHWLARALSLRIVRVSPPLVATFGRAAGELPAGAFEGVSSTDHGWEWCAQVEDDVLAWVRLSPVSSSRSREPPELLRHLQRLGRVSSVDATWRHVPDCAGAGYTVVGDAAAVVDPLSGHGVLSAVMSGMMAAEMGAAAACGTASESVAAEGYRRWMRHRFDADTSALREFYGARLQEPCRDE